MTRALTRTNFHSSRFIRTLADLSMLDAVEPRMAFAEKLGLWVDFAHAITLSAVHKVSSESPPVTTAGATSVARAALGKAFARVRAGLVRSINRTGMELSAPEPDALLDLATVYEPYRRYYLAQQREIALKLPPLRTQLREALGQSSLPLRRLAALDAALEQILGERESKLFATVPGLLERRFRQLHKAHQQALMARQQADNPALWMQAGAWLAVFCQEMQTVLLAELDVRMQPALGLVEAYSLGSTTREHSINE
jgi:hypothetical protein